MSHDRDHDHPPAVLPPAAPKPLASRQKPDSGRKEHPVPREPVDPRTHPSRA